MDQPVLKENKDQQELMELLEARGVDCSALKD